MEERRELMENELEEVVGGKLRWSGGKVYPVDNPSAVYHYGSYSKCTQYIRDNWTGGEQNEDTLIMLKDAGLVW